MWVVEATVTHSKKETERERRTKEKKRKMTPKPYDGRPEEGEERKKEEK